MEPTADTSASVHEVLAPADPLVEPTVDTSASVHEILKSVHEVLTPADPPVEPTVNTSASVCVDTEGPVDFGNTDCSFLMECDDMGVCDIETYGSYVALLDNTDAFVYDDHTTRNPRLRNNDRKFRMMRRKRLNLRRKMLSFDQPDKVTIFRRLRFIHDSSDSDDDFTSDVERIPVKPEDSKTSRKRVRNVDGWKRNKIKRARESGSAYISHRGVHVSAKKPCVKSCLCREKCRYHCSENVNDASRQEIFSRFYGLTSTAQDAHLFGCITASEPKLVATNAATHREVSAKYEVTANGTKVRICKLAFQKLHGISEAKVKHIVDQCKTGQSSVRPSTRGRHNNRPNKVSEALRNDIRAHIQSLPAERSHYSRAKNQNRMYLSPTLSINSIYRDYVRCRTEENQPVVSRAMYGKIFDSVFNLGFGSPRTDTCSRCDMLQSPDDLQMHKQKAESAFQQQRIDRADARSGHCAFISFDMEKTLPLPKLSVGEAFYLRQLWLYNAGIHLISEHREAAYFHIWTESEGHRGMNEIGSSLLAFLNVANIADTKLVAWSDSCCGQNKNFGILCFWQYLLLSSRFQSIEHKYPEPGHSYLDSDRDFGKIEIAVKRRQNVYTVDDYQSIMVGSQCKVIVTRMGDKMTDIAGLKTSLDLVNQTVNVDGEKIEMRDKVRWVKMTDFGTYYYKHSFDHNELWKEVKIFRGCNAPTPPQLHLLPAQQVPIKAAKVRDIQKQLKYIPVIYQGLYTNLVQELAEQPEMLPESMSSVPSQPSKESTTRTGERGSRLRSTSSAASQLPQADGPKQRPEGSALR